MANGFGQIQRPINAYMVFFNEFLQEYKERHPEAKYNEVHKKAGKKWRSMNSEDKIPFEVKAMDA